MGKATGLIGNWSGKVGNMVGYNLRNSNNKVSQGVRVYQPQVRNPKSYAQALQRMRLKPANNFYRALKEIIDRGFEGIPYGNASRQKFMGLALQNNSGPYLTKGDNLAIPGKYVISDGSLVPIAVTLSATRYVDTDLYLPEQNFANLGALSAALIANNTDVRLGDQLTFIEAFKFGDAVVYRTASIYITDDTSVSLPAGLSIRAFGGGESGEEATTLGYTLFNVNDTNAGGIPCGAAVIQSRESASGQHLRSSAVFAVYGIDQYFTQSALDAAVASYMSDAASSDWPEDNTGVDWNDISPVNRATLPVTAALVTSPTLTANESFLALSYVTADGGKGFFYVDSNGSRQFVMPDGTPATKNNAAVIANVTAIAAAGYSMHPLT